MAGNAFSPSVLLWRARRHPHAGLAGSLLLHLLALAYVSPQVTRQALPEPGTHLTVRMALPVSQSAIAAPTFSSTPPAAVQPAHARETPRPVLARRDTSALPLRTVEKQSDPIAVQPEQSVRSGGAAAGDTPQQAPASSGSAPPAQSSAVSAPAPVSEPPGFNAAYLDNPAPAYPALSRRIGEQGKVLVRVFVEADGRPSKVELRTSSGFERLDQSALDAVRRWRFTPARQGEVPVADWVIVPIAFNLRSA